jgi:DNA topoisomerase VI subunit B
MTADADQVVADFKAAVNMTARQLEKWLDTDESREVGDKGGRASESVGHKSGRQIVELLGKKKADYTPADLRHIAKVAGYVRRHLAQRPEGDIRETPWRYSLMN